MKTPRLRLYLDTSVFGGVFDEEFAIESRRLFDAIKKRKAFVMISDLVFQELEPAPEKIRALVGEIPRDQLIFVETTLEAIQLRDEYLSRKILTPKSTDDATHVALATINRADACCHRLVEFQAHCSAR